jgi:hypothetical protein
MPALYQGTLDATALTALLLSQVQATTLALAANSTLPANAITGAGEVTLINTTATPGTQTTRTAAQMYADLQQQLGLQNLNGMQFALRIVHQGAGTLTLAAGTGVSLGTGTTSVATGTSRDYVVTVTSPASITIQTTGGAIAA